MIAGIDPAYSKPNAFAIFDDNNVLIETGKFTTMLEAPNLLFKCQTLYIEDQYLAVNPKTFKQLSQAAGKFIGMCEYLAIDYELVTPAVWQGYFNISKKPRKSKKHPNIIIPSAYKWKKAHQLELILKAQEVTGLLTNDDDIACAMLIGAYGIRRK